MTPSQGATNVCKAGVAYQVTEQSSFRSADGKKVITEESTVTICRRESSMKNNESAAKDAKSLKSMLRKTAAKSKSAESQSGEVNHGLLSISDRKKALDYRGAGHTVRGPKGTSNYRMMTAEELRGVPKRAAGTPTRATGTPKK